MPCPENQYYIDGSLECFHIAADTHHFLMETVPDADAVLDGLPAAPRGGDYWRHLAENGLRLEELFLRWRAGGGRSTAGSVAVLTHAPRMFSDQVSTYARALAEAGRTRMDSGSRRLLDDRYMADTSAEVARRGLARAAADLDCWDRTRFGQYQTALESARPPVPVIRLSGYMDGDFPDEAAVGKARLRIRQVREERRKIIKRSARLLSRLIGGESTRLFIGGEVLRIEGRLAVYEMRKASSLDNAHGGFQALSVYDRDDPRLLLCKLCIYTAEVPLLDHIASLVMHIRGGMEEDILRIGNAREVDDRAYDMDWLRPHLPVRHSGGDFLLPPAFRPDTPEQIAGMARLTSVVARDLFARIFRPHAGLIRAAAPCFGRTGQRRVSLSELASDIDLQECLA